MEITIISFIACLIATFSLGAAVGSSIGKIINNIYKSHITKLDLEINRLIDKTRRTERATRTTSVEKIIIPNDLDD